MVRRWLSILALSVPLSLGLAVWAGVVAAAPTAVTVASGHMQPNDPIYPDG